MAVVVRKVFHLLDCFKGGERVLSLAELTRRTGLPKATVHRLTSSLLDLGVLARTEHGFTLGLVLFDLGGHVALPRSIRELALPFLGDLYEATHHIVHLGVLDRGEVLYLDKIAGREPMVAPSRVAGRMPAHCTAIGKALMAFAPEETVKEILCKPLERRTPHTITAPETLRRQLATVRETGIAHEREESARGIACVAAPILQFDGTAVAAVSVSGRLLELDERRATVAVEMTSLGISRALGNTPRATYRTS